MLGVLGRTDAYASATLWLAECRVRPHALVQVLLAEALADDVPGPELGEPRAALSLPTASPGPAGGPRGGSDRRRSDRGAAAGRSLLRALIRRGALLGQAAGGRWIVARARPGRRRRKGIRRCTQQLKCSGFQFFHDAWPLAPRAPTLAHVGAQYVFRFPSVPIRQLELAVWAGTGAVSALSIAAQELAGCRGAPFPSDVLLVESASTRRVAGVSAEQVRRRRVDEAQRRRHQRRGAGR